MTDETLYVHTATPDHSRATLSIDASKKSAHTVNPRLYGKFTEHLGSNIYNGLDAQILRNPTFGKWRFGSGDGCIDGGVIVESNLETIAKRVASFTQNMGLPAAAALFESYKDSLSYHWSRLGAKENVRYSPDVGPFGGRAQRIEVLAKSDAEAGVAQFTYLPLHRTRKVQFRLLARASANTDITLSIGLPENDGATARSVASVNLLLEERWKSFLGTLEIPADVDARASVRVAITTSGPANMVVSKLLLYPSDHVHGADPDVIKMLKDSKLPLMRWPGGNFVSGYRWRDGVGPIDQRPTVGNPAWDGLEYNFYGTDEFIAWCRVVGCEPEICVNGGDGTPEEAAAWVEYCNGSASTPMGKLRAQNGHPEPYNVKIWEVGNEISGSWQVNWTYSGGYADRYKRFSEAMLKADPTIQLIGCGCCGDINGEWNQRLIADCAPNLRSIADHILNGVRVGSETDPTELYHAFMGHSTVLGKHYRKLRDQMTEGGIKDPKLAVTECQLFPRWNGDTKTDGKLTPKTMINPATMAEALYLATIVHECIRMGDFVELFTHSATVNHGGGLRKQRERVYGNPVHYAHAMSAPFMNGTPVAVELASGTYETRTTFSNIPALKSISDVDAMAVLSGSGDELIVMLVHRSATAGTIQLALDAKNFRAAPQAEVMILADEIPHGQNTMDEPERISPKTSSIKVSDGKVALALPAFSLTRLTLKRV